MYADYTYYQTEYGGKMSSDDFKRFGRRAERRIDGITGNKLQFSFPTNERSVESVKDCVCELADFLYQIDAYNAAAMESMGTVAQADGTVKGKVITSVSSGSESIGYSASSSANTAISEAAKDKKVADAMVYSMVKDGLTGVADSNGVNLMYAGIPYPVRNAPISRPPEDKPVEKPETPPEESAPDNQIESKTTEKMLDSNEDSEENGTEGIGYVDSVIVYNHYKRKTDEAEQYFGTRFDNVRVESTEGANIVKSGLENANVCTIKVDTASVKKSGKSYKAPKIWEKLTTEEMVENFTLNKGEDFFAIVSKADLGIDVNLPEGMIDSDIYPGGFFEYVKNKYGYAYSIDTVDVYTLIPRFEIGGK